MEMAQYGRSSFSLLCVKGKTDCTQRVERGAGRSEKGRKIKKAV